MFTLLRTFRYSYLVLEGNVEIVSPGGLHLSSIGSNELFGEASFILRKNRTITAIAGENGVTARLIKSDHLIAKLNQDIFLSALVRKLETRLSNSNDKADGSCARYARYFTGNNKLH